MNALARLAVSDEPHHTPPPRSDEPGASSSTWAADQPDDHRRPIEQTKAMGAQLRWLIRHDAGCPLGDSILPMNRAGIVPTIFAEGLSRCAR